MQITFENLPHAVSQLNDKLDNIEQLLKNKSNTQSEIEKLLSIKQASEFLNLSVPTLYLKVRKAEIPFSKKGGRLYFNNIDLKNWIKEGNLTESEDLGFIVNIKSKKG